MTQDTWQPIDTAPKDGAEFLGYDSRVNKMDVCAIFHGRAYPVQFDGGQGPLEDEFAYQPADITHWMPLPQPPAHPASKPDWASFSVRNGEWP